MNNSIDEPKSAFTLHDMCSDRVIVWFGGINEKPMSENLAKATGCDVISILDDRYSWYMKGALPHHASIEDGVDWISNITSSYKKKIFIGQSSGGYGALLYGSYCAPHLIVAFSPQTRNMANGQNYMCPQIPIVDLQTIYTVGTSSCPIIINIGQSESDHEKDFFWDDWRQISSLRAMPYVTLIVHPFHNHNISGMLKQRGHLYRMVTGAIHTYIG